MGSNQSRCLYCHAVAFVGMIKDFVPLLRPLQPPPKNNQPGHRLIECAGNDHPNSDPTPPDVREKLRSREMMR